MSTDFEYSLRSSVRFFPLDAWIACPNVALYSKENQFLDSVARFFFHSSPLAPRCHSSTSTRLFPSNDSIATVLSPALSSSLWISMISMNPVRLVVDARLSKSSHQKLESLSSFSCWRESHSFGVSMIIRFSESYFSYFVR